MKRSESSAALAIVFLALIILSSTSSSQVSDCYNNTANPIPICTCIDLNKTRNNITASYKLQNNVDCSDTVNWNSGAGWSPIATSGSRFSGTFNGNNYNISGLYINRSSTDYQGLFAATTAGAQILNLGLVNVSINGSIRTGSIAGAHWGGTINNSFSTGTVFGKYFVGGLSGESSAIINNSFSHANVSASGNNPAYAGGLVGYLSGGTLDKSYATGTVSSTNSRVGGLVGEHYQATIINSYSTGNVFGSGVVGGLAGIMSGSTTYILSSYSTSNVTGTSSSVGGLVGFVQSSAVINNSYARGNVSSTSGIGGLVGYMQISSTIYNSYATGKLSGSSTVGGLVGTVSSSTCTDSFWDNQTTGKSTSACGTGKTTSQMKNVSTFTDTSSPGLSTAWDFVNNPNNDNQNRNYWDISTLNDGYPFLTSIAPSVSNPPSCGQTLNASTTLSSNIAGSGNCFTIGANSLVINGNGKSITGNGSGSAFTIGNFSNITIANVTITNFTSDFSISNGDLTAINSSFNRSRVLFTTDATGNLTTKWHVDVVVREWGYSYFEGSGSSGGYCGDRVCGSSETQYTCPYDCSGGESANCGNGFCGFGETPSSCPADCGGNPPAAPGTSGINVTVYNVTGNILSYALTNSQGRIPSLILTEFFQNSTTKILQTPHSINTSKEGTKKDGRTVNLTATGTVSLEFVAKKPFNNCESYNGNQTTCTAASCSWENDTQLCRPSFSSMDCSQFCGLCTTQGSCSSSSRSCIWQSSGSGFCRENFTTFSYGTGGSSNSTGYFSFVPTDCLKEPHKCDSQFDVEKGFVKYETMCSDSVDNDKDGSTDCSDIDCSRWPSCTSSYNSSADTTPPKLANCKVETDLNSVDIFCSATEPTNATLSFYGTNTTCSVLNTTLTEPNLAGCSLDDYALWHQFSVDSSSVYSLSPNTTYFYKLSGYDQAGLEYQTACLNFTTKSSAQTYKFRIAYDGVKINTGSGLQSYNFTSGSQEFSRVRDAQMQVGGFTFGRANLVGGKSLNFTDQFLSGTSSEHGTKFTGFNSSTWLETAQNLGMRPSDNVTIIVEGTGDKIYKCDDNGANCVEMTQCITLVSSNSTHKTYSVAVAAGFSTYSLSAPSSGNSGNSGSSGGGGGSGSITSGATVKKENKTKIYECISDSQCKDDRVCYQNLCVKLFDIKLIEVDSPIGENNTLSFKYFLKGMANISSDVLINFWLENEKGIISSGQDTIYIGFFEEKTEQTKIFLPKNLTAGQYEFYVQVTYENYQAKSHRTVYVNPEDKIEVRIVSETIEKIDDRYLILVLVLSMSLLFEAVYFTRKALRRLLIKIFASCLEKTRRRYHTESLWELSRRAQTIEILNGAYKSENVEKRKLVKKLFKTIFVEKILESGKSERQELIKKTFNFIFTKKVLENLKKLIKSFFVLFQSY